MMLRTKAGALGGALLLTLAILLFPAWTPDPAPTPQTVEPPRAAPAPEYGENGMVVSARREASQAGVEMLKKGGNAVDAAVATGFALAVVYPLAGNIGGGGFMVIRQPDGSVTTIDHREEAPSGATQEVYLNEDGEAARERSRQGHLASGVPGTVHGLLSALDTYGTLDRATVMAPAIRLAREGFHLTYLQAQNFNESYDTFAAFESTTKYFTKGSASQSYRPGEHFVQPDLARTLERIRNNGIREFYEGRTADLIVEEMQRGDGLINHQDLQSYTSVERDPVTVDYRGYTVHGMGPPSSGGVAVGQILHAAEMKDIGAMGYNSSSTAHYLGEAMKRVFADRAKWLGDPDHVDVPTDRLASTSYMQERMASFDSARYTPTDSVAAGQLAMAGESMETTHYSVADSNGMAVSITTTINSGYGSKVVVDGAGFFLNNEMNDFVLKPGVPNIYGLSGSEQNLVAPSRRMVSSMSPTLVEDPDGRLFMVIGAPGGSTIITTTAQVIMNVIDHGMDIEQAVTAGRIHHQWKPRALSYEKHALSKDAVRNLKARGWEVTMGVFGGIPQWGRAQGIHAVHDPEGTSVPRVYYGGADPRRLGEAIGF